MGINTDTHAMPLSVFKKTIDKATLENIEALKGKISSITGANPTALQQQGLAYWTAKKTALKQAETSNGNGGPAVVKKITQDMKTTAQKATTLLQNVQTTLKGIIEGTGAEADKEAATDMHTKFQNAVGP